MVRPQYEPIGFEPKVSRQIFPTLIATLGGLSYGLEEGWIAPALPGLKNSEYFRNLTELELSWLTSVNNIGAAVSVCIFGYFVEVVGRKWSMMLINIPILFGWILITCATSPSVLITGRFFTGFVGAFILSGPLYICEISQADLRGRLCISFQILIGFGTLFLAFLGIFLNWWWLGVICILFAMIQVVGLLFIPDSPFSLLMRGRIDEGKSALKSIRGTSLDEDIRGEFVEIYESAITSLEMKKSLKYKDLIDWKFWKPCIIPVTLVIFATFSGWDAVSYNAVGILSASGIQLDPLICSAILSFFSMIPTFFSLGVIDKYGRRFTFITSAVGSAVFIFVLGIYYYVLDYNNGRISASWNWIPLTSLIIYNFAFNLGMTNAANLLVPEFARPQFKGLFSAIGIITLALAMFIETKGFQDISHWTHMWVSFLIFSGFAFISGIFVYWFVPETKGIPLSEIHEKLFN